MITIQDIIKAKDRISNFAHETPVLKSSRINKICGCNIYFKCENLQRTGSFKFRGAVNAVGMLKPENMKKGVVTHSSGNFAQALALSAKLLNMPAYIVMPENASKVKINAVKEYGGEISFCTPNLVSRETKCNELISETGAEFIHPYNDDRIIAGQGTCAYELLNVEKQLFDIVIAPVGGGGLLSGTAVAAKSILKNINVIGAEPEKADDTYRSFRSGYIIPQTNPQTIADGLLTSLGDKTFEIIRAYVDDIALCTEAQIISAMKLIFENLKLVVEPSGAVPLAAILNNPKLFHNQNVGVILSGGNVNITQFKWK
ncbi:MAG: pyridoxal-phosphate dependent enzyme [Bacteroidales bacterium]|nr:pyridoxal-phosphate dependent enzyme [Bacteroidales bacterium]